VHPPDRTQCPWTKTLVCIVPGDVTVDEIRTWKVFPPTVALAVYPQGMVSILFAQSSEPFLTLAFVTTVKSLREEQVEEDWPPMEEQTEPEWM
jgi:hypothetical protein